MVRAGHENLAVGGLQRLRHGLTGPGAAYGTSTADNRHRIGGEIMALTRNEKIGVYGTAAVVSLETLRHFTWRDKVTVKPTGKPFTPVGMMANASTRRR